MQIVIAVEGARTDCADYFRKVVLSYKKLTLTPLVALLPAASGSGVTAKVVVKPAEVATMPDDTPILGQWAGEWKSDFFSFTAGQLKVFAKENPQSVYYDKEAWGVS